MTYGDTPMEGLYTNAMKPYFRAPHIYLSFPMRYFPGRNALSMDARHRSQHVKQLLARGRGQH